MKHLLLIIACLIGLSCSKNDDKTTPQCEFSDPLEDLAWLKEYKESLSDCATQISIFQGTYKKQTVFYSLITDPLANYAFGAALWDCEGNVIRTFEYDEREEFYKLVTTTEVLYRCKEVPEDL